MSEPLLTIRDLTKRFGGVLASDAIGLSVPEGDLHAIIGPNGAGKTSLIGQLAGEIAPDRGVITIAGRDVTNLRPHQRSLLGLARSFQVASLFADLTVLDNVALAIQAHAGHSFRFWADARRQASLRDPARAALARVALEERADIMVSMLSHGERRQLELAMVLATNPRLLLLDEPMAGLGAAESVIVLRTLEKLKEQVTILLIEHDMDAVFALADRISVLVYGRIIATGTPAEIRSDPAVQAAYLGRRDTRTHGVTLA